MTFKNFVKNDNNNVLEASYRVSYRIVQQGEAHTIAESLIKPCVKDVVASMIGEEHAKLIDCVPPSVTTISRSGKDVSNFCEKGSL
ncbi:transposase [Nephila pilipes]|uniref:Transposase n=1 Tax=Nephila pilipes TaxID=299642 RepID=A0A8X6JMB7_NEPPI|nr:transposase [Nephila pilipes]